MRLTARLYRQFDANPHAPVPAESYGGWQSVEVELDPTRTALVVMHAWDCGPPHAFPGWRRSVDYMARAEKILAEVFPRLLATVRSSPLPVFHVVGGRDYYSHLPGHQHAVRLAGGRSADRPPGAPIDESYRRLQAIRREHGFPGLRNQPDIDAGFAQVDFAPQARPLAGEGIGENGPQLAALAREKGVNHLIYVGFALNWCLWMSPGGMVDLGREGFLCSTIEEAVTAVENRETAREEREKQQALWRVTLEWGFVFQLNSFLQALSAGRTNPG